LKYICPKIVIVYPPHLGPGKPRRMRPLGTVWSWLPAPG